MSLILAAPTSGAGKTTLTLGILRALARRGEPIRAAKSGPDYIDPQFHTAASGTDCVNLDAWAMTHDRIRYLAAGSDCLIIEGAMGLFDGAPPNGKGATADLARILDIPVVLIVDSSRMSHSVAPLVGGFKHHDPRIRIAGIILNRIGSPRHLEMLTSSLKPLRLPIIGAVPRDEKLARPSRHLGLVQAGEMPDLEPFLDSAADVIEKSIDLDALLAISARLKPPKTTPTVALCQNTKRIAIAQDVAFAFTYKHKLDDWTRAGATLLPFSPLANEPVPDADLIYLPGGYPELHAAKLAAAETFLNSLRNAAKDVEIYGECGGYMMLGETIIDAEGQAHKMAGLLQLETSFANRKLHLGYRNLRNQSGRYKGHEFHYASTLRAVGPPLFEASDAEGKALAPMGLVQGNVSGSFAHIIDKV